MGYSHNGWKKSCPVLDYYHYVKILSHTLSIYSLLSLMKVKISFRKI